MTHVLASSVEAALQRRGLHTVKTLLVTAGPGEVVRGLRDLGGNAIARRDVERWITRQEIEQAEAERLASNRAAQLATRRVRTMVAVSVMALGVMIVLAIWPVP